MKMLHEGLVWKISTGGASPLRGAGPWRSYSYEQVVKTPTTTSIQLNTTSIEVGFDTIMTVHHPPPRNSIPSLDRRQGSVN